MSTSGLPPLITPESPDSEFANGLDSLPSSPTTSSSSALSDDDLDESDAEKEWKESLQQLELLLTVVVVPYVGKYIGRKCAYWGECTRVLPFIMRGEPGKGRGKMGREGP